jgi:hypothetical protein
MTIPKYVPARIPSDADLTKPYIGYPMILRGGNPPAPPPPPASPAYKPDSLRGSNDKVEPVPLPHNTTRTPSATAEEIKIQIDPNVLDQYDMYTYHYKLFITSLENSTSGAVLTPEAQTIIVESGITDITIDNVELQGIAVPSLEAGTGTQTLLKFQIHEPGSAGLMDKMYYESLSLGIGNWLVMPCYLQLEFRGRTVPSSEPVTNGAPGTLSGLKWIWPIKLTDMKAQVNTAGTKYDVTAIFYDEFAQSNALFTSQQQIVLNGLDTFGDAMQQLKEKLNNDAFEKTLSGNYSMQDTFEIVVDPELEKVGIAIPTMNKTSTRGADYIDFNLKVATYNPGTSVDKIIDSLLASTSFYQEALQSARTRTATPEAANAAAPMRNFWRVITETKPMAYDMLRQDNSVHVTIYVVKYNLGLVEANPSQTGQTPETLQAARKRLVNYNNSGILRKKYNYIFTGLNDQVITFDLNMNFSFAATLSRFGGIYLDTNNSDVGVAQRNTMEALKESQDLTIKTLRFIHDPKNADKVDVEVNARISSIGASNISSEEKNRQILALINNKQSDLLARAKSARLFGGFEGNGEVSGRFIQGKSLLESTVTNPTYKFVSDVDPTGDKAKQAQVLYESVRRGKLRPKPYRESNQDANTSFGIDSNSDAGRARTSSLFSTALYSSLDASLTSIKMTIKGDPFWLYPKNISVGDRLQYKSNLDNNEAIKLIKEGHRQEQYKATVNPFGTDNFIVIRFRTPKIYNDVNGYTDAYNEIETFSGIYKVVTITSRFENGKFTQELSCILDDLINLKDFPDFLKQIEEQNKRPDPVIDTRNLAAGIPNSAGITDKIKDGGVNPIKGVVDTVRDAKGVVVTTTTTYVDAQGWTTHLKESSNLPKLTDAQEAINARLRR